MKIDPVDFRHGRLGRIRADDRQPKITVEVGGKPGVQKSESPTTPQTAVNPTEEKEKKAGKAEKERSENSDRPAPGDQPK